MFTRKLVVLLAVLQLGCAARRADSLCGVSSAELEVLKARGRAFLADQLKASDVNCEDLYNSTANIRGHGCAIGGGPAIREGCVEVLDGNFAVVFDRATLQPKELLEVVY